MFFKHKSRPQMGFRVDLGDLESEKEQIASFLQSHLKGSFVSAGSRLTVHSEQLSAEELQRAVMKFVYHRNFNRTHWVAVDGKTVKINRFKSADKKKEKHKKSAQHQTAIQSWGI